MRSGGETPPPLILVLSSSSEGIFWPCFLLFIPTLSPSHIYETEVSGRLPPSSFVQCCRQNTQQYFTLTFPLLGTPVCTIIDEFLEKFQGGGGGVISDPKNFVAKILALETPIWGGHFRSKKIS